MVFILENAYDRKKMHEFHSFNLNSDQYFSAYLPCYDINI